MNNALKLFAEDHHGLVTRDAARATGCLATTGTGRSSSVCSSRPSRRGTSRRHAAQPGADDRGRGLRGRSGAMASHRSAAHLWGVPRPENDPVDIILDLRSRRVRSTGWSYTDPATVATSPRCCGATSAPRTSCGGCATSALSTNSGWTTRVGHVLGAALASPRALRTAIDVHARRGRHGVPAFRRALDAWLIDGRVADSVLERTMNRLLHRHALPPAQFHAVIAGYEVDFWIVGTPIVLECDGWATHGRDRRQFERDRRARCRAHRPRLPHRALHLRSPREAAAMGRRQGPPGASPLVSRTARPLTPFWARSVRTVGTKRAQIAIGRIAPRCSEALTAPVLNVYRKRLQRSSRG